MQHFDVISNPKHIITKSTILGGLVTFLCIAFGTLLFFKEYSNFQQVNVNKIMYLDSKSYEEKIRVWLKIRLMKAPCGILSLDIFDDLEHHRVDVPLKKTKLNSLGGKFIILLILLRGRCRIY
jgi:uncharacterized membrane protein YbhN (UPF0104 family)